MTEFVKERGAIKDPVDLRVGAPPNGASLRHDEHRDVPFAKEKIKGGGVLAHNRVEILLLPPNNLRISCGPSWQRPHKPSLP
jgi:hypothetical protein